jgi:putative ABC transport system permease protein
MVRVARRGIAAHRFRLVSTLVAVLLGVSFMCGTAILGDTVQRSFDEVFVDVYKRVDVVVRSDRTVGANFGSRRARVDASVVPRVAAVPGVAVAEGHVEGQLRVIDASGRPMYNPQAGPPTLALGWPRSSELNGWAITQGRPPNGDDEVVIDRRTAREGGYGVGDRVRLTAAQGTITRALVGIATFSGLETYSGTPAVLFDVSAAQALVGEPGRFDAIYVVAAPGVDPNALAERVRAAVAVGPGGAGVPAEAEAADAAGLQVLTGEQLTEERQDLFGDFVSLFVQLISAFGMIALFVGTFIIYNTFSIIVAQRSRELAVLRAVGASRRQVLGSVLIEASLVGALACALGVAAGAFVANLLRSLIGLFGFALPDTPLVILPIRFVVPVTLAMLVTILSALVPAWRAARTAPVAVLRASAVDRPARPRLRLAVGLPIFLVAVALVRFALDADAQLAAGLVLLAVVPSIIGFAIVGPVVVPPIVNALGAPLTRATGITGRLAERNARRNPSRTSTTASALVIGVSLVCVVTVAASSLSATVSRTIDRTVVGDFVVTTDSFLGISTDVAPRLAATAGVKSAAGVRAGAVGIRDRPEFSIAVDPQAARGVVDLEVAAGSLDRLARGTVAVARPQADRDGVKVGDHIPVTFVSTGVVDHEVVAIYDRSLTRNGEYLFSHEGWDANVPPTARVDARVLVTLEPGVSREDVRPALEAVVAANPTVELLDIASYRDQQVGQVVRRISYLYALLGLALIIGVLGIANTLLLSVHERTRELGLLRTVGARAVQLSSSVLQEAVVIAALGALFGVALGVVLGWAMVQTLTFDQEVLFAVPVGWLAAIAAGSCAAGLVAGLYPARRAAKLDVLEAIAFE